MVKVLAAALMATMTGMAVGGWVAVAMRDALERIF
jgi:hypothetical protein